MPYKSVKELPAGAKKLPPFKQHAFMSSFNDCHKAGKDEGQCFRIAYSAAENAKGRK